MIDNERPNDLPINMFRLHRIVWPELSNASNGDCGRQIWSASMLRATTICQAATEEILTLAHEAGVIRPCLVRSSILESGAGPAHITILCAGWIEDSPRRLPMRRVPPKIFLSGFRVVGIKSRFVVCSRGSRCRAIQILSTFLLSLTVTQPE